MLYSVKVYSAWTLRRNNTLMSQQGHQGMASCVVERVPSRDWQWSYRIRAAHLLAGTAVSGGAAGAAGTAEAALMPLCCCSVLGSQGVLRRCDPCLCKRPCLSA